MEETVVLFIDDDPADVEAASAAFGPESGFRLIVARSLAEGLAQLAAAEADIILVNLQLPDADGMEGLWRTRERAPDIPIIALGKHDDPELALQIVRAGAQDYLVKGRMSGPSLVRCVQHTLERHRHFEKLMYRGRMPGEGKSIAFLGVKGGAGTTTTVVNLATALGSQGRDVLVVELGSVSSLSLHLKRPRPPDAGDRLAAGAAETDSRELAKRAVSLPFGFRALFSPPRGAEVQDIRPHTAHALVRSAGEIAELVLVDLPAQISSAHRAVIPAVDFVVLVMEPDALSAEFAVSTSRILEAWGLDESGCGLLLVNRAGLVNSIWPQDLRTRVGREVLGVVPPSGDACMLAFQAGRPLFALQPGSKFSLAIQDLAEALVQNPVRTIRW